MRVYTISMNARIPSPTEIQLLSLVTHERNGREVAKLFKKETGKTISYGTLYTTFRRLKEAGWVTAQDRPTEDGRERLFRISGAGAQALERGRGYYQQLASFGVTGTPRNA